MPPARKRAAIWTHFDKISETTAKCKICKNNLSHKGGSTANLKRHLSTKHVTVQLVEARVEEDDTSSTAPASATSSSGGPSMDAAPTSSSTAPASTSSTTAVAVSTAGAAGTRPRVRAQTHLIQFVSRPVDPQRQRRMDEMLAKMIAQDFQPYSLLMTLDSALL